MAILLLGDIHNKRRRVMVGFFPYYLSLEPSTQIFGQKVGLSVTTATSIIGPNHLQVLVEKTDNILSKFFAVPISLKL